MDGWIWVEWVTIDNFGKEKNNEKLSNAKINCIVCRILFSSIFLKVHAWESEILGCMHMCKILFKVETDST